MKRYLRRPTAWVGIGLTAFVLTVTAVSTGIGGVLIMAGLIALGTGLYTLVTRRGSWLALSGRKTGAAVITGALVVTVVGGGVYGATNPDAAEKPLASAAPSAAAPSESALPTDTASPSRTSTPSPTPAVTSTPTVPAPVATASPTPIAKPGTALALLDTIPVKGRAPKTGYDRTEKFGHAWKDVDRNGCDTRNDVLRRDLTKVVIKANTHGCVALGGTLRSPYTGETIRFVRGVGTSDKVQIDHVVALMDAWQSGAQKLDQAQRESLANDPLNLLAVDGRSNAQKQAGNAATWLPAQKSFRCAYVARQITVKAKYELWVTPAEHDAMARVLQKCPSQKPAVAGTITLMPEAVGTVAVPRKISTAPQKTSAPDPAPKAKTVHPGSFCAPVGAQGVTKKGTPMACTVTSTDDRARWRSR